MKVAAWHPATAECHHGVQADAATYLHCINITVNPLPVKEETSFRLALFSYLEEIFQETVFDRQIFVTSGAPRVDA
jgi:hypothetical protein